MFSILRRAWYSFKTFLNEDVFYTPSTGSFKVKFGSYIHCREIFHNNYRISFFRSFYFVHGGTFDNVLQYISNVEKKLRIKDKSILINYKNNRICYVKPSRFWTNQKMFFSLYSILLRAGMNYSGQNIIDVTDNKKYLEKTKAAFTLVLERKNYTGEKVEWFNTFNGMEYNKAKEYFK